MVDQLEPCHCGDTDCAYAGAMWIAFDQIDDYMKSHRNEVIILHFNRDVDGDENAKRSIANKLAYELEKRWDPSYGEVRMSTHARWPTLRQAIESKQRIFIFMDNHLAKHLTSKPYVYSSNSLIDSTWQSHHVVAGGCGGIIDAARDMCDTTENMVELAAFGTWGLCTWDMAWQCSWKLGSAVDECYSKRKQLGKTVNIILVDYPVSFYGDNQSVMEKARIMNERNIEQFQD